VCDPGRFGNVPGATASACAGACSPGYACPAGSTSPQQVVCPLGTYSLSGAGACTQCAAGRFGASLAQGNASCTGPCSAGFACPAGSANATARECPAGSYSPAGAGACSLCPAGVYGSSARAASSACSGPCAAGRFGDAAGQLTPGCAGPCLAGYACPAGSTSATQAVCAAGRYSTGGAGVCSPCAGGYYCPSPGSSVAAPPAYVCSVGHACPPGSVVDAVVRCAPGYFCPAGTGNATGSPCWWGRAHKAAWHVEVGGLAAPGLAPLGTGVTMIAVGAAGGGAVVWAGGDRGSPGDCDPVSGRLPACLAGRYGTCPVQSRRNTLGCGCVSPPPLSHLP
jgi:hypothetical protein